MVVMIDDFKPTTKPPKLLEAETDSTDAFTPTNAQITDQPPALEATPKTEDFGD